MPGSVPALVRVYVLDDHDIVRRGLRDLLSARRGITVVGDSGSAVRAARSIPQLKPDVMLLDVHLQDGTGIQVCRQVRAADPSINGLLLTGVEDDEAMVAAILAGAAGYLVKVARTDGVVDAVRAVGTGQTLMDPRAVSRVAGHLMAELDAITPRLTDQERTMLSHVLDGLTNREIAQRMGTATDNLEADITALIDRVSRSVLRQSSGSGRHNSGRHRRQSDPGGAVEA